MRLSHLCLLMIMLSALGCREHHPTEIIVDPLKPNAGEITYMIVDARGDTSYRREWGHAWVFDGYLSIQNQHLYGIDGFKLSIDPRLNSTQLSAYAEHYRKGYSSSTSENVKIDITSRDPVSRAISGNFEFHADHLEQDSVFVKGSFYQIDLLDKDIGQGATSTIDQWPIGGNHQAYYFPNRDSLTFVAMKFGEESHPGDALWYRVVLTDPRSGVIDLADSTRARIEFHWSTGLGSSDFKTESLYSSELDELIITSYDPTARKMSGRFKLGDRSGSFENVSWNVIGPRE